MKYVLSHTLFGRCMNLSFFTISAFDIDIILAFKSSETLITFSIFWSSDSIIGSCENIAYNVLALGEEADFEALNCLPALNLIRSTKLQLSTEPAFLPNACYKPFFVLSSRYCCRALLSRFKKLVKFR